MCESRAVAIDLVLLNRSSRNRTIEEFRVDSPVSEWHLFLGSNCIRTFEDVLVGRSQERTVIGNDASNGLIWKCFVDGTIKLNAVFSVYGNTILYSFIIFGLIVLFARY